MTEILCVPGQVTHVRASVPVATTSAAGGMYVPLSGSLQGAQEVALMGHLHGNYWLCGMLRVTVTVDTDGTRIAASSVFPVHGDGATAEAALADFRVCLAEYYEMVEEGAQSGDPYDAAEAFRLGHFICRR